MLNTIFIQRRVERIRGYYNDLDELLTNRSSFSRKLFFFYALERVIQLIVDELIDINNHVIDARNFSVPDNFQSSFQVLAEHNVLPEELALRLAPIVGLRNRLVHRYETIDREMMVEIIEKEKNDIRAYTKAIEHLLDSGK